MTQVELAERLGVNKGDLNAWESGRYIPDAIETQKELLEWLAEEVSRNSIRIEEIRGDRIRNERLRRIMTPRELANHLGVHSNDLYRMGTGHYNPPAPQPQITVRMA